MALAHERIELQLRLAARRLPVLQQRLQVGGRLDAQVEGDELET